jgi:Glycosyltransferases, probably involved in cell wall biogenesis
MMKAKKKKIAFCITCMNRLEYIRQTLLKNITDNFLPDDVEFVLLDYNSTDGLEDWVKTLNEYIDSGMLVYYRTNEPGSYYRSHSRNMAFGLSDAEIVCNLDADNFLGKGFALDAINKFEKDKNIFYTSDYHAPNVAGRMCVRMEHFLKVRGYNELFTGWGSEDIELVARLKDIGLKQIRFNNPEYYNAISHSHEDRISQEPISLQLHEFYISYTTPYKSELLLLYKDSTCESCYLVNNKLRYYNTPNEEIEIDDWLSKEVGMNYILIEGDLKKGKWKETDCGVETKFGKELRQLNKKDKEITDGHTAYYPIANRELRSLILVMYSNAVNSKKILEYRALGMDVNSDGFGRGIVYRNFDYNNAIALE